jgi:hypothetical protein
MNEDNSKKEVGVLNDFRCDKCSQLQFKYRLKGDKIVIEIKCYACNNFSYFNINLQSLLDKQTEHGKS